MKTLFHFHERALPGLRQWISEVAAREPGGGMIAQLILDDIRATLSSFRGELPDTIADVTSDPILYWWRYDRDFWISFVVRERGLWKWKRRRIIVYSVGERPPDRVVASFHRM